MRLFNIEDLIEALPEIAARLRSSGHSIGTSQLVEAARILESYAGLRGQHRIEEGEAAFILASVLSSRGVTEHEVQAVLKEAMARRGLRERAERILIDIEERLKAINARPGARVSRRKLPGGKRERRTKVKAYMELKRIGVIESREGGDRVVDQASIRRIAWTLARNGYEGVEDAVRSSHDIPASQAMAVAEAGIELTGEALSRIDGWRLLKLGEASIRKGNRRMLKAVAEEVSKRILSGHRLEPGAARRILDRAGLLTPDHDKMLYMTSHGRLDLGEEDPDIDTIIEAVRGMDQDEAAMLIARALKRLEPEKARSLLSGVDPYLLWEVKKTRLGGVEARLVRALGDAARAVREAMLYTETGNPGRADMARDYIDRARMEAEDLEGVSIGGLGRSSVEELVTVAEAILSMASADSPAPGELSRLLSMMDFEKAVKVLRGLYRSGDPRWRGILEWALERIIYMASSREGLRPLPKWRLSGSSRGRLDLRRSIYRRVRASPDPLVYRVRKRSNLVSLALDTSGSMQSYSIWALGMAAIFARSMDKIVLFSHTVEEYRGPFGRRDIARILLSARFQGYTDVYNGINAASDTRAKRIVVISDLTQTVDSGDPLEASLRASRAGKKLIFIVPLRHDEDLRSSLERAGFTVTLAHTPRHAARQVLRAFSR